MRVVLVHGSYGTPESNWLPWLAGEIKTLGHAAIVPAFPSPAGQSLESWKDVFSKEIGKVREDMILVGHSLGAGFILSLLENAAEAARGTFLVSGFLGKIGLDDYDEINRSFVCRAFDWPRVCAHAGTIRIYDSDNDPYVPLEKGRELADCLGAELITIPGGGHLNAEAGFQEFPRLLADVRHLLV